MASSNSSVNDNTPWYYYLRRKGRKGHIGLVDGKGNAISSASINLKIFYEEIPDEIDDDDDIIGIPEEFLFDFAKGCAYEYLLTEGIENKLYFQQYEFGIKKAIKRVVDTERPAMIQPIQIVPGAPRTRFDRTTT